DRAGFVRGRPRLVGTQIRCVLPSASGITDERPRLSSTRRNLFAGLAFIAPNVLGFLAFMLFPMLLSFAMMFTNWDLKLHNMYKDESVRFVGLANLQRLFSEPQFWRYLGNTLFIMIGIPFSIAG